MVCSHCSKFSVGVQVYTSWYSFCQKLSSALKISINLPSKCPKEMRFHINVFFVTYCLLFLILIIFSEILILSRDCNSSWNDLGKFYSLYLIFEPFSIEFESKESKKKFSVNLPHV